MDATVKPIAAIRPVLRVISADPKEPTFTIGAADPAFELFLRTWSDDRMADIQKGICPLDDVETVVAARTLLIHAAVWRDKQRVAVVAAAEFDMPAIEAETPPPSVETVVQTEEKPPSEQQPPEVDLAKQEKVKVKPPRPQKKLEKAVAAGAAKQPQKSAPKTVGSQRVKLAK